MSMGALNMQSLAVKCEVDADPADHVKFAWTYNNTRNVSPVSTCLTLWIMFSVNGGWMELENVLVENFEFYKVLFFEL